MSSQALLGAIQNYPLLDAFLTMLFFFLWILWIFLVVRILLDVFRSQDMGGWGKAGWTIFIIVLPLIGVLVYLIARGHTMQERDVQAAKAQDDAFKAYVREAAGSTPSNADQLAQLAKLHSDGVLSDAEFEAQKAKLL